ncbi:hypothetical protein EDD37DRAFT_666916 [Exophiala viscosa]|uniref:uncharacterized protein n=1 Tax=Exophiala viscosa TaxID=2486360 RepID=UPI00218F9E6B|nr:hypothetical protein EDD37DRAFT_666916 [Exophiala viscosa]
MSGTMTTSSGGALQRSSFNGVPGAVQGTVSNVLNFSTSFIDRSFPQQRREEWKQWLTKFASDRPYLASFMLSQIALNGLPLILFACMSISVFVFSLLSGILVGVIGALLFVAGTLGFALLFLLPTLFFSTSAAVFIWLWAMGGYVVFKWFSQKDGSGAPAKPAALVGPPPQQAERLPATLTAVQPRPSQLQQASPPQQHQQPPQSNQTPSSQAPVQSSQSIKRKPVSRPTSPERGRTTDASQATAAGNGAAAQPGTSTIVRKPVSRPTTPGPENRTPAPNGTANTNAPAPGSAGNASAPTGNTNGAPRPAGAPASSAPNGASAPGNTGPPRPVSTGPAGPGTGNIGGNANGAPLPRQMSGPGNMSTGPRPMNGSGGPGVAPRPMSAQGAPAPGSLGTGPRPMSGSGGPGPRPMSTTGPGSIMSNAALAGNAGGA